jgi:REP element-mobilizing transposase RayT
MRQHRILEQGVWYEIRTVINNREPLFRRKKALDLFAEVFVETGKRFAFETRGMRLKNDLLTFFIKPEDGFRLPDIMKWMKQVFAVRYNVRDRRIGHIWGDRYWSRILTRDPPVDTVDTGAENCPVKHKGPGSAREENGGVEGGAAEAARTAHTANADPAARTRPHAVETGAATGLSPGTPRRSATQTG